MSDLMVNFNWRLLFTWIFYLTLIFGFDPFYFVSEGEAGWARAIGPRTWKFPRDHGAHPEYRTEWWYFTGNLSDNKGRPYGYQLTFNQASR